MLCRAHNVTVTENTAADLGATTDSGVAFVSAVAAATTAATAAAAADCGMQRIKLV